MFVDIGYSMTACMCSLRFVALWVVDTSRFMRFQFWFSFTFSFVFVVILLRCFSSPFFYFVVIFSFLVHIILISRECKLLFNFERDSRSGLAYLFVTFTPHVFTLFYICSFSYFDHSPVNCLKSHMHG